MKATEAADIITKETSPDDVRLILWYMIELLRKEFSTRLDKSWRGKNEWLRKVCGCLGMSESERNAYVTLALEIEFKGN